MKGKLPIILSALIALVTVLGLVAAVVPTVVSADTATDQITPVTMPTQGAGNLALNTSIVALAQAADGTLFAGVRDDSGLRWPVTQGNRSYAVFTSSNGYGWTEGYKVPWDDNITAAITGNDPIVAIVPVPDYSSNNTIVYMITQKYVYVSTTAGKTFSRLDQVPGVNSSVGNLSSANITSLDVAANPAPYTGYVCMVGTAGVTTGGGVFTYGENGLTLWRDKMIGNDVYTTSNFPVYAVKFSTGYTASKDGGILAVYSNGTAGVLTIRDTLGTWGIVTLDAPIPVSVTAAKIALATDFSLAAPVSYVKTATNVYKVTGAASPGLPVVKDLAVGVSTIYDIAVSGSGSSTQALAAVLSSGIGLQVYRCTGVSGFAPAWIPAHKQPIGNGSAYLAVGTAGAFVASQNDSLIVTTNRYIPSGVSKLVVDALGQMAWNGVGLIDTELATRTYLYSPCITGGPVWLKVSPANNVDNTIFMVTGADNRTSVLWRTANGGTTWDLVGAGNLTMGDGGIGSVRDVLASQIIDPASVSSGATAFNATQMLSVRTPPTFNNSASTDQTVFMLGAKLSATTGAVVGPWLFKSVDAGNIWKPILAMPTIVGTALSQTAWCVVNDNTVILSDNAGYIYKTTDNGISWTNGVLTAAGGIVTSLKYFNATTGLVVLAGVSVPASASRNTVEVWISLDGANTFAPVGTSLPTIAKDSNSSITSVMVDFDNNWNTNNMVYVAFGGLFDTWSFALNSSWTKTVQGDAGVWRSPVVISDPTSSLWTKIVSTANFVAMAPALVANVSLVTGTTRCLFPTGLVVGPQGTIYVPIVFYDEALKVNTWGGFIRCLDGTAASTVWNFIDTSLPGYGGLWLANVEAGSSNLFSIGYRYDGANGIIDLRLLNYEDTLTGQAGSMVPASGATGVGTISGGLANVVLSWSGISGTAYTWQVALDSAFNTIVSSGTATVSMATATGLQLGTPYYWRVQALLPALGPWSAVNSFTTVSTTSGAPTLTSPANGASIATTPIFTWSVVTGATSYNIQVATDTGFTAIVKAATATSNIYASDKLSNNVYYWRVQATVGSTTTAWSSTGAFTLGASTTTSTPAWVWVLIVLGIVLAIFVLVLILRTRRPV